MEWEFLFRVGLVLLHPTMLVLLVLLLERHPNFLAWKYEIMNPDGSYSFVNLDWPKYTPNVPWNGLEYFQTLLIFHLVLFDLLTVSDFRSYTLDWCRPCGGEYEDDWRLGQMPTYHHCLKFTAHSIIVALSVMLCHQ